MGTHSGSTASSLWDPHLTGRLDEHRFPSGLLEGNPLQDPAERPLLVYVPPGYEEDLTRRYPSIYVIQGYTGQVLMWRNREAFRPTFIEQVDDVFSRGAPACIVVFVDAWTSYGGSQYVDSPGTGRYHSYLCDEVVPWIDAHYRTLVAPDARAITGKSSGGFGAMITPMLRPDLFGALATHAGDALYEFCYIPEFPQVVRALRPYGGDIQQWWAEFRSRPPLTEPSDPAVLTALGVAACFSADDDGTPRLPFDPVSGVIIEEIWERWLAWDPVRMVPQHAEAVRSLTAVWIDAGTRDDYSLDVGAEAYRSALLEVGLTPDRIAFELFDATHAGIGHRYPLAVQWLAERLSR